MRNLTFILLGLAILSLTMGGVGCRLKNSQKEVPHEIGQVGEKNLKPHDPKPSDSQSGTQNKKPDEWVEKSLIAEGVRVKSKNLRTELKEELKSRFSVPELEEIQSEYSGGFRLYRIPKRKEAEGYVFIEPKVYIFGTAQGGNVLSVSEDQGKMVTLTFPVSLVDGLRQSVPSYSGKEAVLLPESFRISQVDRLKEDLRQKLGSEITLQTLPSCPKVLSLIYLDGEKSRRFHLKPTISIDKRCLVNEFFTVSVKSGQKEMKELIQRTLNEGPGVQVLAQFQVEYRAPVAFHEVSFSKHFLYRKLRDRFVSMPFGNGKDSDTYLSYQLSPISYSILSHLLETVGIDSSWFPVSQGSQYFQDAFFTETTGEAGCPTPNRCFRVKSESEIDFDSPIDLMWTESESLGATRSLTTAAFVRGLAESYPLHVAGQVNSLSGVPSLPGTPSSESCVSAQGKLPGCPGFSCEAYPESVYCKTRSRKASIHQFQVFPGSRLKVSFDRITQWGYELPIPREDTPDEKKRGELKCADNRVIKDACIEYEEGDCQEYKNDFCAKPKDECDELVKTYEDHCREDTQYETDCGFLGWGHCGQKLKLYQKTCEKVESGSICRRYKTSCDVPLQQLCVRKPKICKKFVQNCNQYTVEFFSKYTYSEPWIRPKNVNIAQGATIEELWDGLDIEFSWLNRDGTKVEKMVCPLKAFPHLINGYSITLSLENQTGANPCKPFNEWNIQEGRWPEVSIVNHISFERQYLCGFLEWTHSVNVDPKVNEHILDRLLYTCPESGEKSDHPIVRSYRPIVDLDGSISILGRSMDTVSDQKQGHL